MDRLHGPENRAPTIFPDGIGLGPAPADKQVVLFYIRRKAAKVSPSGARGKHAPGAGNSAQREECY
jgi:hypothetical protein